MANKKTKKPITERLSIYEQEYILKQQAKELLKKIKEDARYINVPRN
jgi:hypothetical protein